MSDWKRKTQEVSFDRLQPELAAAIQEHIEQYNLGEILSDTLICVQTDSEKPKKGLFGSAETVNMGVVLTKRWLIWATQDNKAKLAVLSAQLRDILVQDYAQTQFARLVPDSGMQVSGRLTDVSENSTAFIGLEPGPVGDRFKGLAIQAVQEAKK